jgi:hypothetical protein
MKLYPKQLNSLQELKQEKERLSLSIGNNAHQANSINTPAENSRVADVSYMGIILDLLSNDLIGSALLKLGLPMFKKAGKFAGKNVFGLGKEVFGGYLKWKALELGYRWMRRYLNKDKNK